MVVHIRKQTGKLEWEIRQTFWRKHWKLYWVSGRPGSKGNRAMVWTATFRELSNLDDYISIFEKPMSELERLQASTISQFQNDEIDEAEFIETAHVYSLFDDRINEIIADKREESGKHND